MISIEPSLLPLNSKPLSPLAPLGPCFAKTLSHSIPSAAVLPRPRLSVYCASIDPFNCWNLGIITDNNANSLLRCSPLKIDPLSFNVSPFDPSPNPSRFRLVHQHATFPCQVVNPTFNNTLKSQSSSSGLYGKIPSKTNIAPARRGVQTVSIEKSICS